MNRTSALVVALLLGCGGTQPGQKDSCSAATCDGCCLQGVCHQGVDNNACGRGGYACDVCVVEAGQQCIASACTTTIGGTGGGHAGTGGGMQASGGGGAQGGKKRIFVTAASYTGTFGETGSAQTGADARCALAAQSVSLGGTWIAWLASGTIDAWSRINDVGPWYLLDGTTKVFNNKANMTTLPLAALNMTEQGTRLSFGDYVWTGSDSGGHPSGTDCYGWGENGYLGTVGAADSIPSWETATTQGCSTSFHLYCIEQ